ncbi:class I SAM-dependent methyltransferase [Jidongwangia harbinensis]|uniref:class I SAM-dependent methyltransferase n=1 Tax=Jidongwangia harbinensis TaxID=2878561 RepID=UPI001CD93A5A|nr:class I SAM-dependent methyltransferase [Jidongwangia harbinensis]MCA2211353.1 class I SAM-dependent methyltransferase [Jidongwangia harbinensis]
MGGEPSPVTPPERGADTREPHEIYDAGFFDDVGAHFDNSARTVVPLVTEMMSTRRVVDIGSGEGTWAAQFLAHGCAVLCVDGGYVRPRLRVPETCFVAHDLREPLPPEVVGWQADLTVCLEVAEHLPPWRGPSFVADLCRCADRLLFSAAVPGQGGPGHVNERPVEYWIELLEDQGFAVSLKLRRVLRGRAGVAWWYAQNILTAVRIPRDPVPPAPNGRAG